MQFIKGYTFALSAKNGKYADEETKQSLALLKQTTASDTVVMCIVALMENAHCEHIDYKGSHMPTDSELIELISYAKEIGLRVILKPIVNCKDRTWRAHINFFDVDIPGEAVWSNWFQYYFEYMLHYADIAQQTGCEMLIIGCEMVQAQRKEEYWRKLVAEVKKVYTGLISYNTDKYQEEYVSWWDAVDVISSSGYYPINNWDNQLDRIEKVVLKYQKPFFFAEAGCMSKRGASHIPNNWELQGALCLSEQAEYYSVMFNKTAQRKWVGGFGLWDWQSHLYSESEAEIDSGYSTYGKPANDVIFKYYSSK